MRHVKGNCPHGPRTDARILNKMALHEQCVPSYTETTGQWACELCRLISLSCHSVCCLLSITEWVYHTNDGVTTIVVRQAGEHDGWVNLSDTVQLAKAGRVEPVQMDQITPTIPA